MQMTSQAVNAILAENIILDGTLMENLVNSFHAAGCQYI